MPPNLITSVSSEACRGPPGIGCFQRKILFHILVSKFAYPTLTQVKLTYYDCGEFNHWLSFYTVVGYCYFRLFFLVCQGGKNPSRRKSTLNLEKSLLSRLLFGRPTKHQRLSPFSSAKIPFRLFPTK